MFDILYTITLILLALDHVVTGILGVFSPTLASKMYGHFFGVKIPKKKEYTILFRPWGALGIFAGIVGTLPLFYPERYNAVLYALLVLLILRIWMRVQFSKDARKYLHLSLKRNSIHITIIATSVAIIVVKILQL